MKRVFLLILFLCIAKHTALCQKKYYYYKSAMYDYKIEIPKDYTIEEATGRNIDLKAVDKYGNSIIIVVKKLEPEAANISVYEMDKLISKEQWEYSLQEYVPNPKYIKSGNTIVNGYEAFYIHYTSQDDSKPLLYHIGYSLTHKGFLYIITATCNQSTLNNYNPIFFRAIQSFSFNKESTKEKTSFMETLDQIRNEEGIVLEKTKGKKAQKMQSGSFIESMKKSMNNNIQNVIGSQHPEEAISSGITGWGESKYDSDIKTRYENSEDINEKRANNQSITDEDIKAEQQANSASSPVPMSIFIFIIAVILLFFLVMILISHYEKYTPATTNYEAEPKPKLKTASEMKAEICFTKSRECLTNKEYKDSYNYLKLAIKLDSDNEEYKKSLVQLDIILLAVCNLDEYKSITNN